MTDKEKREADYEKLLEIVKKRRTCRDFSPEPFPEEYLDKILEAARWAMSGANGQPWEFVVVRSPEVRKELFDAWNYINVDFTFWMEQQRVFELRQPRYKMKGEPHEALEAMQNMHLWRDAPVVIAVIGDGRKQWSTIMGGHTFGLDQTHLSDGLAMAAYLIHLSAASLGLTSQWVSIHLQDPFKKILDIPPMYKLHTLIPIGYPTKPLPNGYREALGKKVHQDKYDMSKFQTNEESIQRLYNLRQATYSQYSKSGYFQVVKNLDD